MQKEFKTNILVREEPKESLIVHKGERSVALHGLPELTQQVWRRGRGKRIVLLDDNGHRQVDLGRGDELGLRGRGRRGEGGGCS